ncbi:hypothetical protein HMPREF0569_1352 [Micrococcus luteus SK58]|nr:hypothetical protein HMPREF0569_1352 [Micrococcus luteus SK58]
MPTCGAHGHAGRPPGWGWSRVPGRRAGAPAPVRRASHRAGLPGQARGPCGASTTTPARASLRRCGPASWWPRRRGRAAGLSPPGRP